MCYIRAGIFVTFSQLPTLQLYCFSPSIQQKSIDSFSFFNRRYQIFLISYFLLFVRTRWTRLSINNLRYDLRTILEEDYASVGLRHYQQVKRGYRHGHQTQHNHWHVIIWENYIIKCNYMCWCETRLMSDTETRVIRGVYVFHCSIIIFIYKNR